MLCIWLATLCATLAAAQPALATTVKARSPNEPKAIIVVLHGVSWEELQATKSPPLQGLLQRAAVGVMNTRPLDSPDEFAPYVSIGAGRPAVSAVGRKKRWLIAGGWPGAMYDGGIEPVREANLAAHTQAEPGLLGTILRMNDKYTGLVEIGLGMGVPRMGQAIAMDRDGTTDVRASGSFRRPALSADSPGLLVAACDLVLVDFESFQSLTFRTDQPSPVPGKPDTKALPLLHSLDPELSALLRLVDPASDLIIITSPTCPPYRSPKQISYSPIAIVGPGFGPGLLTSSSTRRLGVVANSDIAPTILRYFGIDPRYATAKLKVAPMSGHPMMVRASDRPLDRILAISRRGSRLYDLQWRFAPVYALSQFFAFMGVGGALLLAPAWARRSRRRLRLILLLAMAVPLGLFVLGPLDLGGAVAPYTTLAALAAAFAWFAFAGSPPLTAAGALLTATAGGVAIDALTGGHLLNDFMINFGAMSASRFYGIGNETMGAVVAAAAIGGGALVQQAGRSRVAMWALGLWLLAITVVVGGPWWGANWGGGVTAAFAFVVMFLGVRAGAPRLRHWLAALIAAALVGGLGIVADTIGDARTWSHIGDSASLVSAGGAPAALTLMTRKLQGNLRVIAVVPYTMITLVVLLAAIWLTLKPPAGLRAVFSGRPMLWAGIAGAAAGALITVLVNDSGIVAASSVLGLVGLTIPYAALLEEGGAEVRGPGPAGPGPQSAGVPAAPGPRTRHGEAEAPLDEGGAAGD